MKRSWVPKTAVCVLRVEEYAPHRHLITITTTPDVETAPRDKAVSVTSCEEAIRLVASFLLQRVSADKCLKELDATAYPVHGDDRVTKWPYGQVVERGVGEQSDEHNFD
jgi:4'-phosphopantetheinyl transferase EntD